ncbi:hypothetical protein AXF42_Ash006305 [Apostasia shenzhenica]|uniref:Uncharacterized protein n=1 Tax=Apostasia shenzhenica TaxID=1088818 RepID=A0A2I0AYP6_9ASPA|nr:hypothetical protein AXF42_Ash006305 [Apostasia shenzhenica]
MASCSIRSALHASFFSIKPHISRSKTAMVAEAAAGKVRFRLPSSITSSATGSPARRFSGFSRSPAAMSCCVGSLFPLHEAVAAARLTSGLSLASRRWQDLSQGIIFCRAYPGP